MQELLELLVAFFHEMVMFGSDILWQLRSAGDSIECVAGELESVKEVVIRNLPF